VVCASTGVAVASLFLAGCGAQDGSNPAGTSIPTVEQSSGPVGNTEGASPDQIQGSRLEDCPASDASIPARADGLPDLTLPCLGRGDAVRLAGVRGKPMVVNVWASWCGPCKQELPMMGAFYRAHGDQVRFLGVDLADDRQAALALAANTKMTFPSVQDPESQVRAGLKVVGVPTTLFVRPDGSIAGRASVISSDAELAALIEKYLQVKVS
jgi:cytochrome c biogenesis protein CcmG, thiol:disulfide interchange protein DsbE